MKFTIRALLLLTLMAALITNVVMQRRRIDRVNVDIARIESEIHRLNFDADYVDSHTRVCELAIENNPLPSPYYVAAKQRHEQAASANEETAK